MSKKSDEELMVEFKTELIDEFRKALNVFGKDHNLTMSGMIGLMRIMEGNICLNQEWLFQEALKKKSAELPKK